jgi:hypothetical protein
LLASLVLCLPVVVTAADTAKPDPGFLEFLGTFASEDPDDAAPSDWVDFIESLPSDDSPPPPPAPPARESRDAPR